MEEPILFKIYRKERATPDFIVNIRSNMKLEDVAEGLENARTELKKNNVCQFSMADGPKRKDG